MIKMTVAILQYTLRSLRNDNGEVIHDGEDLIPAYSFKRISEEHERIMAENPDIKRLEQKVEVTEYFRN